MDQYGLRARDRYEMSVSRVVDFSAPHADGDWACQVCGESFAVSTSWQIQLTDASTVVSCGECADHARRNGTVELPADSTIVLRHRNTLPDA